MAARNTPSNILHTYRTAFAGKACVVATDAQGNVIRRANLRTYPDQMAAAKHARRANFKNFERGTAFRAVPVADLTLLGC